MEREPASIYWSYGEVARAPTPRRSSRSEGHRHAALLEIGLHQLAALPVVLGEALWIEHRFLEAVAGQRRLERGIDLFHRIAEGNISHRRKAPNALGVS